LVDFFTTVIRFIFCAQHLAFFVIVEVSVVAHGYGARVGEGLGVLLC